MILAQTNKKNDQGEARVEQVEDQHEDSRSQHLKGDLHGSYVKMKR